MANPEPRLRATGLACVRGGRLVFEGIDLSVGPGEAVQVEGRNGAGKSSLLRMLGGLLDPAGGTLVNDFDCAWLGADATLKAGLSLRGELEYWARLDGHSSVGAALSAYDLTELADLPVEILSSGQRRRAALSRVHASGAALWLLDEPAVGLDTASVSLLAEAVRVHRASGGAVIVATHGDIGLDAPARLVMR